MRNTILIIEYSADQEIHEDFNLINISKYENEFQKYVNLEEHYNIDNLWILLLLLIQVVYTMFCSQLGKLKFLVLIPILNFEIKTIERREISKIIIAIVSNSGI